MLLAERLAGAVWGHLAGDALGVPYEFRHPSEIGTVEWGHVGTHDQPPGTWSDDGALMLALLDSLLHAGPGQSPAFDTTDQARRALDWYVHGRYAPGGIVFDIGNTTRAALHRVRDGTPAEVAGPAEDEALGNGSLMRILSLPLVERQTSDALLIEHARRASRVTHGSPACQVTCALYCLVVRRLLMGGKPREALLGARRALRVFLKAVDDTSGLAALDALDAWPTRGGRGHVFDAFWSAWDAFAEARDYRSTVERAIRYGHDTDTTAAIAGGLAGARWGLDSVPGDWRRGLRGHGIAQPLVDRLVETDRPDGGAAPWRTSTASPLRLDLLDLDGTAAGVRSGRVVGRVGITFLPGKRYVGRWTGPHWRDLETDVTHLEELGVDTLLLLVEDRELRRCRVADIAAAVEVHGIDLVRFPIRDPRTPRDQRAFRVTIAEMLARVQGGETLAICCRGGLDRSGLAAACLLREAGLPAGEAIDRVHAARRGSLTRLDQLAYVRAWPPA